MAHSMSKNYFAFTGFSFSGYGYFAFKLLPVRRVEHIL